MKEKMPFVQSLLDYGKKQYVPFHTPGHKIGHGAPSMLQEWMGPALKYDLGVMYAIDDLHEPTGALQEAQQMTADLYGADHCWFSINGTTSLIEAMIMATVGPGDTIIIPREAHRSVMAGLVLSGACPVYMPCAYQERFGVTLGVRAEDAIATMDAHPEAKAILLVYPNYYGVAVDIECIVKAAHDRNMVVLVDEAHGPHLIVDTERMPVEAIAAGADLVAQSTHKSLGALTQTSWLLGQGNRIDYGRVRLMHNMLQSTSPNYILLASLDMARSQLKSDRESIKDNLRHCRRVIDTYIADSDAVQTMTVEDISEGYSWDYTKLLIDSAPLGWNCTQLEQHFRSHGIEVELMAANHVLLTITLGDTMDSMTAVGRAIDALPAPPSNATNPIVTNMPRLPEPEVAIAPRDAMYGQKRGVSWQEALGHISGETWTYYPPGIPFLSVGERITPAVLQYIEEQQQRGLDPTGGVDSTARTVLIMEV